MTRIFDRSLLIGLALVGALLAFSIGLAYRNTQMLHEHNARITRTHAVLTALDNLIGTVTEAETGARGFVISGNRTYLQPYNIAVAAIDEEIGYLEELTRDNARQRARFEVLQRRIATRRSLLRREIGTRSQQSFAVARKVVLTGRGQRVMDAIREVAAQMRREEEGVLASRAQASERSYRVALVTELLTGVLGFGLVAAFVVLLRRHLAMRVRAAAALRQEKEWFVTTLGSIGEAVIATDGARRVTYLNAVAETLTGWTRDEAYRQPLSLVFHVVAEEPRPTGDPGDVQTKLQDPIIGPERHPVLVAKDGSRLPVDYNEAPIGDQDKGGLGTVMVFRDVTQRHRAERALKFLADSGIILSSSLNYDATLKNVARLACSTIADYCFFDLTTEDGAIKRVAWAHRDAERQAQLGDIWRFVPSKEFKQDPVIRTLELGQSQFVPHVDDAWLRATTTSQEHYLYLCDLGCASFMSVPVAVKGRTLGALSFCLTPVGKRRFTDVDRTLAEELGRRAGLAVQNASLHWQLQRNADDLRQADRRKDEFLAVLAHELRNPLAPLRNGLQIMRMMEPEGASTAERTHEMMERQLRQMVRLIDDLLDLSRVTKGRLELRKEPVELASVVGAAAEISRPVIEEAGQELVVSLPPESIVLDADSVRLAQVFSNLLHNGAKYASAGTRITLAARQEGDEVIVTVKDAGMGIAKETLSKVFEPFFQAHDSPENVQGGLGIGLTLVKQLVEMHGGRVEARSEGAHKGSEFLVRLPLAASQTVALEPPVEDVESRGAAGPKLRVLVADDNEDAANSLRALLGMMDFDARVAYDGGEAVKLAEIFRPDAVLLDIGMPKLNGLDAARQIRAQAWGRKMTLIALTGYGQKADKRRSKQAGIDHHVVKPVDPVALEKILVSVRSRA